MNTADEECAKILAKVGARVGVTPADLLHRNDADPAVCTGRLYAAALLCELRLNENADEWVLLKLNCTPAHINLAKRLGFEDADFKRALDEIKNEKAFSKPIEPTRTDPIEPSVPGKIPGIDIPPTEMISLRDVEGVIERVARMSTIPVDILKGPDRAQKLVRARDVTLLLLTKHLGLNQHEAGEVLKRDWHDVAHAMTRLRSPGPDRRALLQRICSGTQIDHLDLLSRVGRRQK